MPLPRPLRATTGIALAWGASWGILGAAMGFYGMVKHYLDTEATGRYGLAGTLEQGVIAAVAGTLAGLLFTAVFSRAERGRDIDRLPRWRVTLWGGVAGVLFVPLFALTRVVLRAPLEPETLLWAAVWFAGLGADSGAATIALARRGAGGIAASV